MYDATGPSPDGVQIADGVVYWTTMGMPSVRPGATGEASLDYSAANGGLHAIAVDGTGRRDVVPPGAITTGKQLALADGWLYWGDREGFKVSRVRVDGTSLTDLVVNPRDDEWLGECVGVAVDVGRGQLYWTQKGPAKGGRGRIFRAGLELPFGESADARSDIEILWHDLPEPIDLEIVGDLLYWTDRGAAPRGNTLNRAALPPAGALGGDVEILAGGFGEAIGVVIDDQFGVAYVSDLAGRVLEVSLPGGGREGGSVRVVATLDTPLSGIAGIPA